MCYDVQLFCRACENNINIAVKEVDFAYNCILFKEVNFAYNCILFTVLKKSL